MKIRIWLKSIGKLRATLLALALLVRLPLLAWDLLFFSKTPLILPAQFLLGFEVVQTFFSSIIIVECVRVFTFRWTQSLGIKKHFAFVLVLFTLLGAVKIATAPKTSIRYHNYAWSLSEKQDFTEAERALDIAIAYNPNNAKAYLERSYVYRKLGIYSLAMADCNRVIELTPNSSTAYVSRGQTYYYLKDFKQALGDFNTAIGLDPKKADSLEQWIAAAKKNL